MPDSEAVMMVCKWDSMVIVRIVLIALALIWRKGNGTVIGTWLML